MALWTEIGREIYARRYTFYDQNIVAIRGDDGFCIVDTRISHRQADEILRDLRELGDEPVRAVINTHGHNDHAFGNHRFRPAPIWGHERCARMIRETGAAQIAKVAQAIPDLAADLAEVVLDPQREVEGGERRAGGAAGPAGEGGDDPGLEQVLGHQDRGPWWFGVTGLWRPRPPGQRPLRRQRVSA